ncbi:carbohydrate porin [Arachidicoccus soli]|uniref:Carbohydrate porin n=1 Tax=Arachidicoccus soli TaxID=2341117 RepID=A0A386HRS1_9BACT|nr:carbohydrate porin [Arachidicoccus soli]AYD48131.1 carbohydrate porin [Arachidicoccus soli]
MNRLKKILAISFIYIFKSQMIFAQTVIDSTKQMRWSKHFQFTTITQAHSAFKAAYSGNNSLADTAETGATTVTATLFLGHSLWKNAAIYADPELSGGRGLSSALGVAGALNGESYRVGDAAPSIFLARAYVQQNIPLKNTTYEYAPDDENSVAGKIPTSRITISAGKFSIGDFYDNNKYSHDPRSQFLNWSLMGNGAWDYPANTRGYTMGAVVELIKPEWAIRLSSVAVPRIANAPKMEYNITKAHSETLEFERALNIHQHPGTLRLLFSQTYSRAPSYAEGIQALLKNDTTVLNVISGKAENTTFGGRKFGIGYSFDQELTSDIGIFSRAGWNDGRYASWAFTEIDRSLSVGFSIKGNIWKRANDKLGIATVINGISKDHRDFLHAGGYGFIIGDGNLNYGHESVIEAYYNLQFSPFIWISFDYQFVNNPAYNKDRGPVNAIGIRGHIQI